MRALAVLAVVLGGCRLFGESAPPCPHESASKATTAIVVLDMPKSPLWERYVEHFVRDDGRVVDNAMGHRSTSEGQAYGLFLALVENDQPRFDLMLEWTNTALAGGDLGRNLPAWLWALDGPGEWGVQDPNTASDADLWLAYTLSEAGRLWQRPQLSHIGRELLEQITRIEVKDIPGLGAMLLPGAEGFEIAAGRRWRLNPSYLPPFLLRWAAEQMPSGPWAEVLNNTFELLESVSQGVQADWVDYHADRGFIPQPEYHPTGSYDAIRTYLWVSLVHEDDPFLKRGLAATDGLAAVWAHSHGSLSETMHCDWLGATGAPAPPAYLAALLAWFAASGDTHSFAAVESALNSTLNDGLYGPTGLYYDQSLVLFATGWIEGRYRFAVNGSLLPVWAHMPAEPGGEQRADQ